MNSEDIKDRLADTPATNIGLFGNFGLTVYSDLKVIRRVSKRNQITNSGRVAVLQLLFPGSTPTVQSESRIWSLSVGINPIPPTISDDIASINDVWNNVLDYAAGECTLVESPPNAYYLQIVKVMPDTAANGATLTEAGIFTRGSIADPNTCTDKLLYARQIFPQILKNSSMTLEFDWQLGITIQGA